MLEEHTYGGSKAAEYLTSMLNDHNDKTVAHRVSYLLSHYNAVIHAIRKGIKDKKIREALYSLWMNNSLSVIDKSEVIPDKFKSYMGNLERTLLKRIRNGEFDDTENVPVEVAEIAEVNYESKKIQYIIENFDFKSVHDIMKETNWEWHSCGGVPSVREIKDSAHNILTETIKNKVNGLASGGFETKNRNGKLSLVFKKDKKVIAELYQ